VWPVPDNLYVVVGEGQNHNSPMEWAEEGLPRGQVQDEDSSKVEVKVEGEEEVEVEVESEEELEVQTEL